jgi:hypothetical protein
MRKDFDLSFDENFIRKCNLMCWLSSSYNKSKINKNIKIQYLDKWNEQFYNNIYADVMANKVDFNNSNEVIQGYFLLEEKTLYIVFRGSDSKEDWGINFRLFKTNPKEGNLIGKPRFEPR